MAARALGFVDLSPRECIALMDEYKEDAWIQAWLAGALHTDLTGREYLQHFGNEARLLFGDSFWVDQVLPRPATHPSREFREDENQFALAGMYPDVDVVTITDLRYPNEAQRVLNLGGEVWEIERPGLESDGHASEQPLPRELVTRTLPNVGTLADLGREVQAAWAAR